MPSRDRLLIAVKLIHTAFWALFAGCILALPVLGMMRRFDWALAGTALVLIECAILAANGGRCPLTNVAARYTDARTDNFDIHLPRWMARHNKAILGTLFAAGEAFVLWRWLQ